MQVTYLTDSIGTLISNYAITGSGVTAYTSGVNTSRWGAAGGLYILATGSISITRQVSLDDTFANYGTPYNLTGVNIGKVWTNTNANGNTPAFISFASPSDSAATLGPWVRFSIIANNSTTINNSANTITTLAYVVPEE